MTQGAHLRYLPAGVHYLQEVAELVQEVPQTSAVAFHPLIGHRAVARVHQVVPETDHLKTPRGCEQQPQDHHMCTTSDVAS